MAAEPVRLRLLFRQFGLAFRYILPVAGIPRTRCAASGTEALWAEHWAGWDRDCCSSLDAAVDLRLLPQPLYHYDIAPHY